MSQSVVSRAERGEAAHLTVRTLTQIAEALGARAGLQLQWQGEGLDRLLDAAHAGLVNQVVALLVEHDWEIVAEATFNHYGERGSIDVLAWHPARRALLIVEVKSVVPDIQALLSGVDRKCRVAPTIARDRGWASASISRLIVLPDGRTARRRIAQHAATFDRSYPARTWAVRRWLASPAEPLAGILFLPGSGSTTARHRVSGPTAGKGRPAARNDAISGRAAAR